jgi:hypothetical protein
MFHLQLARGAKEMTQVPPEGENSLTQDYFTLIQVLTRLELRL